MLMLGCQSAERRGIRSAVEPLEQMLLLVFIPVVWSIVTIVCLSVCTIAARSDAAPERELDEAVPLPTYRLRSASAGSAGAPRLRLLDARRA